jgi:propionyl-CoA carboxylase alpha chain
MKEAIAAYEVEGVATTLPFGRFVLDHPAFVSADFDTHFVQQYFSPEIMTESHHDAAQIAALLGLRLHLANKKSLSVPKTDGSKWKSRSL